MHDGSWVLTSLTVGGQPVDLADAQVTLRVEGSRVSGRSAVNRYFGEFTTNADQVTLGPMGMTMMAGPPHLMEIESAYTRALDGTLGVESSDDGLVLRSDGSELVFRAASEVDDWLEDHRAWTIDAAALVTERVHDDFVEAMAFVNRVAEAAEAAQHHPDIAISWNRVTLSLTTHDADSTITRKDLDLAETIDGL